MYVPRRMNGEMIIEGYPWLSPISLSECGGQLGHRPDFCMLCLAVPAQDVPEELLRLHSAHQTSLTFPAENFQWAHRALETSPPMHLGKSLHLLPHRRYSFAGKGRAAPREAAHRRMNVERPRASFLPAIEREKSIASQTNLAVGSGHRTSSHSPFHWEGEGN